MYRLFVAVDLSDQAKVAVSEICKDLSGARWVPIEQLHLTLRFIGDADDSRFRDIRNVLTGVRIEPFTLQLQGVGCFPTARYPRVIWVGVEKSESLLVLQQQVESALVAVGLEPDERKFSPHITLARLKDIAPARMHAFMECHRNFTVPEFQVMEFYLYSSTLNRAGAIHLREAVYSLH